METAPLKSFAVKARVELMTTVGARIAVVLADNSLARVESADAVRILEAAIARDGIEQVIDRVAYTWFNRIIALRFMDANGYTASRVVSPEAGRTTGQPEILAEAKAGTFDGSVVSDAAQATITALLNGTRPSSDPQGESYGLLLEAYCRSWHNSMPFMFERAGDYTELLIPPALLADDSIRDLAVRTLTEEVCSEVEVIGWLYQFYISERKDEVFAGFKRNKKAGAAEIPAATQLFTPHWIVRYLVENSVGRLWLLNNPTSRLADEMEYYIKPVDEETDFLKISSPEELKVIDPAVGSGHMLTYAFDLLYAIYEERGYDPAEIPGLILAHNLYGTEIDPRAGALAAFALTMKAAKKRRLFLKNPVQPNICVLENIHFAPDELDYLWTHTSGNEILRPDADIQWNAFQRADTLGSLIEVDPEVLKQLVSAVSFSIDALDLLEAAVAARASVVLKQAEFLARRYSVVVTNPPYMGSKNMDPILTVFARSRFPSASSDLFAMFIQRALSLSLPRGRIAMVTMQSWTFQSTFAALRDQLLTTERIAGFIGLGAGAFDTLSGEVVSSCAFVIDVGGGSASRGAFIKLNSRGETAMASEARDVVTRGAATWLDSGLFDTFPNKVIAYWLSPLQAAHLSRSAALNSVSDPRVGLQTGDNDQFLRGWWEVSSEAIGRGVGIERRWLPYSKGGAFRRWHGNLELVVDWRHDGRDIKTNRDSSGKLRARPQNQTYYGRPAVEWSDIGQPILGARLRDSGTMFDVVSMSLFSRTDDEAELNAFVSYLNSSVADLYIKAVAPGMHANTGYVGLLPWLQPDSLSAIEIRAQECVAIARKDWNQRETAIEFRQLAVLESENRSPNLSTQIIGTLENHALAGKRLARLETDNNLQFAQLFGLEAEVDILVDPREVTLGETSVVDLLVGLISYAVGCMFGRYSLDEPGLVLADQGSTLQGYLAKVPNPTFLPDADNVIPIVDGDWFEDDIVAGFRKFLRVSFGDEHFEENLQFVTESLGVKDLRDYFVRSFYDDHVKRYKKRPIYWLFRSPKGSFSALIYLHRYTSSTVSTVLTGYLREFIGKLEANLDYQERVAAGMGDASARDRAAATKEADRIRKVLVELRDYEHDILFPLAGQNIELDLDDGVLVNYQKLGSALKDIGLKKSGSDE